MKEKDPSIEPVAIMARTDGYQYLRDYIEKKIKSNLARLRREVFTDLAQVALLQGEIRSLEAVLDYVNTRVEKSEGD